MEQNNGVLQQFCTLDQVTMENYRNAVVNTVERSAKLIVAPRSVQFKTQSPQRNGVQKHQAPQRDPQRSALGHRSLDVHVRTAQSLPIMPTSYVPSASS